MLSNGKGEGIYSSSMLLNLNFPVSNDRMKGTFGIGDKWEVFDVSVECDSLKERSNVFVGMVLRRHM